MNEKNKSILKKISRVKKQIDLKSTVVKTPIFRERDMRKESIDMGSHGASEYFNGVV